MNLNSNVNLNLNLNLKCSNLKVPVGKTEVFKQVYTCLVIYTEKLSHKIDIKYCSA